jgi:hypothetical protein
MSDTMELIQLIARAERAEAEVARLIQESKYPNDTAVIEVELETELIENLTAMSKLCGLTLNDMMKAILGWKMWSLGVHSIPPKETGDDPV